MIWTSSAAAPIWKGDNSRLPAPEPHLCDPLFQAQATAEFLAYLTASRYGRDYFEATGKRTTNLASTNSTKVGLFPIPRPPIGEQRAICGFLDAKLNQIAQIVSGIESQIATLIAYRKSLIHECVTGQRRITEADLRRTTQLSHPKGPASVSIARVIAVINQMQTEGVVEALRDRRSGGRDLLP